MKPLPAGNQRRVELGDQTLADENGNPLEFISEALVIEKKN